MSRYTWSGQWAVLPQEPLGWMHSGAAVVGALTVIAHPGTPTLLFYDAEGELRRTLALEGLLEPHGFCAVDGGIWVGDVGFKRQGGGPVHVSEQTRGRVVLFDSEGAPQKELKDPGSDWAPTSVAVIEETGDIWVADGYGNDTVHRFTSDGSHQSTLTGEEGAGRFDTPHGLLVNRRRGEAELYVSDRGNARIQVFDLEGRFLRVVGEDTLVTPTDMVVVGDTLAVTDFTQARVTILDSEDRLLEHIGANPGVRERDGWPNARNAEGNLVAPELEHEKFNSPHTLAADASGNLYVTEWLIGGRVTKLIRN